MNIFDIYLDRIKDLIIKLKEDALIELPESLNGINVDVPPPKYDCDISTNVSMVLSKINKKSPLDIAKQLLPLIKDQDSNIEDVSIAKPGFINIKFKSTFWNYFVEEILSNYESFGINTKEKKKNT